MVQDKDGQLQGKNFSFFLFLWDPACLPHLTGPGLHTIVDGENQSDHALCGSQLRCHKQTS